MSFSTELEFEAHQIDEAQDRSVNAPVQGRTQWQLTWRRLRSDKVSMIALTVIVIMVLLAIFAPAVAALTHHPVNMAYPVQGENEDGNPVGRRVPTGSSSAPTPPDATCSSASCTGRASRCSSASSPR